VVRQENGMKLHRSELSIELPLFFVLRFVGNVVGGNEKGLKT
jgi:hypothetical protein